MKKLFISSILAVIVLFVSITSLDAAQGNYVSIETSETQLEVNEQMLVTVTIQLDPNTPSADNPFSEIVIDLPSNFIYDENAVNVSDPLNTLSDPSFQSNDIIFDIGEVTTGQTIEINFAGTYDENVIDSVNYGFNVSMYNQDSSVVDSATEEVEAINPTYYEITKTVVEPTNNVYVGDEITYEINVEIKGTSTIDANTQIVDVMDAGAVFVSASEGGTNVSNTTTWNLTTDDINNRSATKRVTYLLDADNYSVNDTVTNNAEVRVNSQLQASDQTTVTLVDDKEIIIPDPISKNSYTTTDEDGQLTTDNGVITYKFEPIDIQGSATLSDFSIIDHVGEGLYVKTIYPGKYEGGGELQYIEVEFKDSTPNFTITDTVNATDVPTSLQDKVKTVIYYYGDVQLPFKATKPPMIDMTVDPELGSGINNLVNDFEVDFSITSNDGSIGDGTYICPPGSEQNTSDINNAKCTVSGSDSVFVVNDVPFASVIDKLDEERLYYAEEEIVFNYSIINEPDSKVDLEVSKIVNDYSASFSYLSNSTAFNVVDDGDYLIFDAPITIKPGESFDYSVTYKVEETRVVTSTDDIYIYFTNANQVFAGNDGEFMTEPEDYLNDVNDEYYNRVLHTDERVWLNQPQANVLKTVTDRNKVYLPGNVDDPDGSLISNTINYQYKLQNVDFGKNSASFVNPKLVDTIPDETTFNESSLIVSGYFTNSDILALNSTATGFEIEFNGELPVGEEIVVDYNVTVNENSGASFKTNTVEFIEDPDMTYTDESIFEASDSSALVKPVATQYVSKSVDKTEVSAGGQVTYTIDYKNTGTVDIKNINFTDELPNVADNRGTTVSSVVIEQPEFINGDPTDYNFVYQLFDGTTTTTLPTDRSTIKTVGVDFGTQTIKPGDEFEFKYSVTTPNNSVNGDLLVNNGIFQAVAYYEGKPYGNNNGELSNTTNNVSTEVIALDPTLTSIGDFVYLDVNQNGIYDNGIDKGLDNYLVSLKDNNGNVISETVTNNGGYYKFTDLEPYQYIVSIYDDIADYLLTNQDISVDTTFNNEVDDADFRYVAGSISGTIFHDQNANGVFDTSESIYEHELNIKLYDSKNELIEEYNTNTIDQQYEFTNLKSGTYRVVAHNQYNLYEYYYTVQTDYTINDNATQQTKPTLQPGENVVRDFGLVKVSKIYGYAFTDMTDDGVYNSEQVIADLELSLSGDNDLISTTNSDGYYEFLIYPGNYNLKSQLLQHHIFSKMINDNKFDTNGEVNNINIEEGEQLRFDVGQVPLVTIGGNFYEDVDNSLTKNEVDIDLSGRTVTLKLNGNIVSTTETDNFGNYEFTDLLTNTIYQIDFEARNDEYFNNPESGIIDTTTHTPGEIKLSYDASVYKLVEINGYIVEDRDNSTSISSVDKAISNYKLELYDENNKLVTSTVTNSDGYYKFSLLAPGKYYVYANDLNYSDYVESDGFEILNNKSSVYTLNSGSIKSNVNYGIYQLSNLSGIVFEDTNYDGGYSNEDNLLEQKVDLYLNNQLVQSTMTVSGHYTFTDLKPGKYKVKIISEMQPTIINMQNVSVDSELQANYESTTTMIYSGQSNITDFDLGLYNYVSIGDLVYIDGNQDGTFDPNTERVAPFVKVQLVDLDGNVISEQRTTFIKNSQNYLFTNINPGTYKLVLPQISGFTYGEVIDGVNTSGETDYFTIYSGQQVLNKDARLILDLDNPSIVKTTIGDQIWEDTNYNGLFDEGEQGIEGVIVQLYNDLGIYLYETTTDENGMYSLDVSAGKYKLKLNYEDSYISSNINDATYLDNENFTNSFAVDLLSKSEDLDFGLYLPSSISGYFYKDTNNDLELTSSDETLENIVVNLLDDNTKTIILSTTTDSNGYYVFNNLKAGDYIVEFSYELKENEEFQALLGLEKNKRFVSVSYNMNYEDENGAIIEIVEPVDPIEPVDPSELDNQNRGDELNETGFNVAYIVSLLSIFILLLFSQKIVNR